MSNKKKIRLVIIDDSAFIRRALARIFGAEPDFEVVGEAADGKSGLEEVARKRPDLVTMDVRMPEMDGLATLEAIMKSYPTPVLMLSSYTQEGADVTLKALELGAVDFVDKSAASSMMDFISLRNTLLERARAVSHVDLDKLQKVTEPVKEVIKKKRPAPEVDTEPEQIKLVIIGSSTGGPPAIQLLATMLPPDLPAAVLVIQHMPVGFTNSFAARLNQISRWQVTELTDGETLEAGRIYVAPSGWHSTIRNEKGKVVASLDTEPLDSLHRPSIDIAMISAASSFGPRCIGVILTGMGKDGCEGARAIKRSGGRVIAESEETAIINGMPKAAAETGAVELILPLNKIASTLQKWVSNIKTSKQ